jgi:hypothetical protein
MVDGYMLRCMVDARFGTSVGACLMHFCDTGCCTWLMLGMVQVDGLVHALVHG